LRVHDRHVVHRVAVEVADRKARGADSGVHERVGRAHIGEAAVATTLEDHHHPRGRRRPGIEHDEVEVAVVVELAQPDVDRARVGDDRVLPEAPDAVVDEHRRQSLVVVRRDDVLIAVVIDVAGGQPGRSGPNGLRAGDGLQEVGVGGHRVDLDVGAGVGRGVADSVRDDVLIAVARVVGGNRVCHG
jgi:hypothetical protein